MTPLDILLSDPALKRMATRLRERPGRQVEPYAHSRYAAIAVVFRQSEAGAPELLMIKRSEYEGDPWSGHYACPGGRMEPTDRDLEETATRETREETGVDLERDGRILGTLDDVAPRTPALPPIIIRPFVALARPEVTVVKSDEVAEAFWVPLAVLRDRAAWGMGWVHVQGTGREVPVFRHGERVVWGLTERILRQMVELLDD